MKKVLALILSILLLVAFTMSVGCKKAEEKKPEAPMAPAPEKPAPAPEQKPAEAPAPAPEKPAEAPKK